MKHFVLAVLVLALVISSGAVLFWNRAHLTTPVLAFSGLSLLLAVGLALPTNLKTAIDIVSSAKVPKLGGTP